MTPDQPCTADQRQRIITEAIYRAGFLAWLADKLVHPVAGLDHNIRQEAALVLRWVAEGQQ